MRSKIESRDALEYCDHKFITSVFSEALEFRWGLMRIIRDRLCPSLPGTGWACPSRKSTSPAPRPGRPRRHRSGRAPPLLSRVTACFLKSMFLKSSECFGMFSEIIVLQVASSFPPPKQQSLFSRAYSRLVGGNAENECQHISGVGQDLYNVTFPKRAKLKLN